MCFPGEHDTATHKGTPGHTPKGTAKGTATDTPKGTSKGHRGTPKGNTRVRGEKSDRKDTTTHVLVLPGVAAALRDVSAGLKRRFSGY